MTEPSPLRWRGLLAVSLLWSVGCVLGAAEPAIRDAHPVLRPGLPWRLEIARPVAADEAGERLLIVTVEQGDQALASQRVPLADVAQLADGVVCHLVATDLAPEPVTVRLVVEGGPNRAEQTTTRWPTWPQLIAEVDRQAAALSARAATDPLLALHLEQAALLVERPPTLGVVAAMTEIRDRLARRVERPDAVDAPADDGSRLAAIRCPVDGSVQPLRIHPCADAPAGVVHACFQPPAIPDKVAWPSPRPAWIDQARANGLAVIEWYPAGDPTWRGVAATRLAARWRDVVAELGWDQLPQFVAASGGGCHAALAWAHRAPDRLAGLILDDLPAQVAIPAPPPGTGAVAASWLADRYRLRAPPPGLPIAVSGALPAGWDARTVHRLERSPEHPEAWAWLRARHQLGARAGGGRVRILEPGPVGDLRVLAMTDWGRPGELILDTTDPSHRIRSLGIAAWSLDGDRTLQVDQRRYAAIAKRAGRATGPLDAYADGAFLVVVGRSGSLAGRQRNRELARAFFDAWLAHSQGAAPWIWDDQFVAEAHPGRDLVLIGDPATNRALAALRDRLARSDHPLPVDWDHRSVGLGERRLLTSQPHHLALVWPHPADDGRHLVILSGDPAWTGDQPLPPLAGWGDCALGPGADYRDLEQAPPPLSGLFDNAWRWQADAAEQPTKP